MANLIPFDPFAEMRALQKQFFGDDFFGSRQTSLTMPTTDVYTEGDKQMIVEAHLPNFEDKDVNVTIDKGVLEIQAEKHEKEEDKQKKYVVRESSSSFYRRISLPDQADQSHIDANMENGILRVTVPFKALPEPKKIAIKKSNK